MISAQNKEIANWAKEYALQLGCQQVRITFVASKNNSFEYRDIQLDTLASNTENRLYLELFVDKKYGTFSSNRLEKEELAIFISETIESIKHLSEDECRCLPDPNRYYKGEIDLDLFDHKFDSIFTEEKLAVTQSAINEVYGRHEDIITLSASYNDNMSCVYMIDSNGFEHENNRTSYSLVVNVTLKTKTDARSEAYWYDMATHWDNLQKEGLGKIALDEALKKVGQEKIASGKYKMLLDNISSSQVLSPIVSAIYGSAVRQRKSFLIDKLDKKVFSEKLTLIDKPHQKQTLGARLYDGEGVATQERLIIDKGIIKTYFIDTYNSLKLDAQPTIASPSGLCMQLGDKNHDELVESIDKGIWVTGFNGGNTNPTTGDFSFGVDGFLIENGKIIKPISEMNITGNLLLLWSNIVAIGNNSRKNISSQLPSILFSDVSFSGL